MLRWFLILWQCFWLVLFLPGHTRGLITWPDTSPGASPDTLPNLGLDSSSDAKAVSSRSQYRIAAKSCCAELSSPSSNRENKNPSEEEKQRCVVCYIAKGYTVASAFTLHFDFAEQSLERSFESDSLCILSAFNFPYYPIGPPV